MDSEENWAIRIEQATRIVGTSDPARLNAVVAPARARARRQGKRVIADGGSGWISIGPRNVPGRIGALALDPERPGVLYAGSAAGGVFESTDGGARWTPLWSDEQDSLAIGGLAVGRGAIYAATGEWVGGTGSTKYHHFPGVGVYVTRDAGVSWTLSPIASAWSAAVAVDPTYPDRVFVAADGALYRSTDGGGEWHAVVSDTISDVVVDPVRRGHLFIGIHGRGVWRSENSGDSWAPLVVDTDPQNAFESPKIALGRRGNGFVAVLTRGRVFVSTNGGDTFVKRGELRNTELFDAPSYAAWCTAIAVDPTDERVLLAGHRKLWRSEDGGRDWTLVAGTNFPPGTDHEHGHDDLQAILFDPADHNHIWVATDGGVFESTNNGRGWHARSAGLLTTQCYTVAVSRTPPYRRAVTTQDNRCYQSEGGEDFPVILDPREGGWVDYDPADPAKVYVDTRSTVGSSPLRKGTLAADGTPQTWQELLDDTGAPLESDAAIREGLAIARQRPDWLLVVTATHRLLHSTDAGAHWQARLAGETICAVEYSATDSRHAYATSDDGRIWHSPDGGVTWTELLPRGPLPGRPVNDIEVDPDNPLRMYLAFGANDVTFGDDVRSLWRGDVTLPATVTWVDVSGASPDVSLPPRLPLTGLALDPANAGTMYASHLLGVHRTTDGGQVWAPFDEGLPNCFVADLDLHEPSRSLFAATMGRGLYRRAI